MGSDDPAVARLVALFETMTRADVTRLGAYYAEDASFKDPFHEVRGLAAIERVYAHMFDALDAPRFVVRETVAEGRHCVLVWDFLFAFRRHVRGPQCVRGASHLVLGADGRIAVHRDYWDAAEELYAKLPLLGALMRALRRRAAAP